MVVSLTGLLVMAVFFAAMLATFRSNLVGDMLVGNAIKEAIHGSGERNRTGISITGGPTLSASSVDCTLRMTGDNTGATSMVDFSSMDLIIQTDQGNNPAQQLTYTTATSGGMPVSTGNWAGVLNGDRFEPGIFNPGETMGITVRLDLPVSGDTSGQVTLATPNGVTTVGSVSLTTPCPEPPSMHIFLMSGDVAEIDEANFSAIVTIIIHDDAHGLLEGATITGTWSQPGPGVGEDCSTDVLGQCSVSSGGPIIKGIDTAFTVELITHASRVYEPADNEDGPTSEDLTIEP